MAWAIAAAAVAGGIISNMGSQAQANAAENATKASADTQRYMFDRSVDIQEPWRLAGQSALGGLMGMTGIGGPMADQWESDLSELDQQIQELEGQRVSDMVPQGLASELTQEQLAAYNEFKKQRAMHEASARAGMNVGGNSMRYAEQKARALGVPIDKLDQQAQDIASVEGGLSTDQALQLSRLRDRRSKLQDRLDTFGAMGGGEGGGFNLEETPGYQFRFGQGMQALDRSAAASGNRLSGRAIKAAQRFGQGIASDEFTNQYNRLANIAGLGQTAANTSSSAAMSAGRGIGGAQLQGGLAQANAIGAGYANMNNSLQSGLQNYMTYQAMQNYNNPSPG